MKIRDIINGEKPTLSFEVFPPKKDTDFANVEAAAFGIAELSPSYMRLRLRRQFRRNIMFRP